jgi:hypothetical protein
VQLPPLGARLVFVQLSWVNVNGGLQAPGGEPMQFKWSGPDALVPLLVTVNVAKLSYW